MTHSLHRQGSRESLRDDFVLLVTPAIGVNHCGARKKLLQILDIIMEARPVNIGFYGHGSILSVLDLDEVRNQITDTSRLRCCFDNRKNLEIALRGIIEFDSGLSIAVSGLREEISEVSTALGLRPHSAAVSLGVYGKTNQLAFPEHMALSTMCGHDMISSRLVDQLLQMVRAKEIDLEEAVRRLGKPCSCGIYNPARARRIIQELL